MRRVAGFVSSVLMLWTLPVSAEVLVLTNDDYVDDAWIRANRQGVIIFQKAGAFYQIDSDRIRQVQAEAPDTGEPLAVDALEPYSGDGPTPGPEPEPATKTARAAYDAREQASPGGEDNRQKTAPAAGEITGQEKDDDDIAVMIGFLQGGGSLIGTDVEFMLGESIMALQAGVGFVGFGAAVNFHFEPHVDSDYLSLCFWNQGAGNLSVQYLGLTYGERAYQWLTGQIGIGVMVGMGDAMRDQWEDIMGSSEFSKIILLYSIGVYF